MDIAKSKFHQQSKQAIRTFESSQIYYQLGQRKEYTQGSRPFSKSRECIPSPAYMIELPLVKGRCVRLFGFLKHPHRVMLHAISCLCVVSASLDINLSMRCVLLEAV